MAKKSTTVDFEKYYEQLFGKRWQTLSQALRVPREKRAIDGLKGFFATDPASQYACEFLPLKGDETLLDMCAAPGGKALYLAQKLPSGSLQLNDVSHARYQRLRRNFQLLPENLNRKIYFSCRDARLWGKRSPQSFNRILLDAPCSSERHLLHKSKELANWSPARTKMLAVRQHALLCSASDALNVGGYLLYLTCALHPQENEERIAQLFRKRSFMVECQLQHKQLEKRTHGGIFLPDHAENIGPLYACLLQRSSP